MENWSSALLPQRVGRNPAGRGELLRPAFQHLVHRSAEARFGEFPEHPVNPASRLLSQARRLSSEQSRRVVIKNA
jgi:hypothetical protein